MNQYAFFSVWELIAPIDRVWDEISHPLSYPQWFPYVKRAEEMRPGDATGLGAVSRLHWRTALPYGFAFDACTTRIQSPHLLEMTATGDLDGTGRWELSADQGNTTVRYYWTVRTSKAWMNLLAPLARPAFSWNHAVVMQAGGEGLAGRLGVRLVRNLSYTADSASPIIPAAMTAGLVSLAILLARSLWRLMSSD